MSTRVQERTGIFTRCGFFKYIFYCGAIVVSCVGMWCSHLQSC